MHVFPVELPPVTVHETAFPVVFATKVRLPGCQITGAGGTGEKRMLAATAAPASMVPLQALKYTVFCPAPLVKVHAVLAEKGCHADHATPSFEKHISVALAALRARVTLAVWVAADPPFMATDRLVGGSAYVMLADVVTVMVRLHAIMYTILGPGPPASPHATVDVSGSHGVHVTLSFEKHIAVAFVAHVHRVTLGDEVIAAPPLMLRDGAGGNTYVMFAEMFAV
jgi:hypothetical protein